MELRAPAALPPLLFMPPKQASARPCEACDGSGSSVKTRRVECKNCDGTGACSAGRGNKFVCPVCSGEGEEVTRDRVKCLECKGTGRRISQGSDTAPQVVGRGREAEAVAPPAGSKSSAKRPVPDEEPEDWDEEPDEEATFYSSSSTSGLFLLLEFSGAPKSKPQPQVPDGKEGIWWEPGVGLVVRKTFGMSFLLNCIGAFLVVVSLILLLANNAAATIIGVLFLFLALCMLFVANKDTCKQLITRSGDSQGHDAKPPESSQGQNRTLDDSFDFCGLLQRCAI
ncbi:hypothetical protein AK812_SmicGene2565 [Symbiodinium microadriaticum]|uniref:Chaperone protein DnaJ n=1 Tax=Symbiodinium microadriaticum TaxID=2951 RepID=A0A1Q9F194_SYMMI|nr:hypothetical protein AK812_SmicGene2565 [Symbiodinium microadriaticum]